MVFGLMAAPQDGIFFACFNTGVLYYLRKIGNSAYCANRRTSRGCLRRKAPAWQGHLMLYSLLAALATDSRVFKNDGGFKYYDVEFLARGIYLL